VALCSAAAIVSVHARKKGKHRRPGPPVHDDLVQRQFATDTPSTL
jgi:hypothetical protein